MTVEVEIAGKIVQAEKATVFTAPEIARHLYAKHNVAALKEANVQAGVFISGVHSRMNDADWSERPEVYDDLYFAGSVDKKR